MHGASSTRNKLPHWPLPRRATAFHPRRRPWGCGVDPSLHSAGPSDFEPCEIKVHGCVSPIVPFQAPYLPHSHIVKPATPISPRARSSTCLSQMSSARNGYPRRAAGVGPLPTAVVDDFPQIDIPSRCKSGRWVQGDWLSARACGQATSGPLQLRPEVTVFTQ
ncbi:hypothetical protein PSPO01_04033 [Paraphaeosphaeria sporulosa]